MDTQNLLERITIDPAISHGKPTIRGMRYPVEVIFELLSAGMTTEEILSDYPDLEEDDILAVSSFAKGGMMSDANAFYPTKTTYEHIVLDAQGQAVIGNTGMKVKQLVAEHLHWGWSPEELHFQHPHLTLGEVYSALAYYWDHRAEIDEAIQTDAAYVRELRAKTPDSPLAIRLRQG